MSCPPSGDPGEMGPKGPTGDDQDCTVQGVPGDPGEEGDPGVPGSDAVITDGRRYNEVQNEIERLKTLLSCCSGTVPDRRRRETSVIGAGGSNTSLSEDLVCR